MPVDPIEERIMSEPITITTTTYCNPSLVVGGEEPLTEAEQADIDRYTKTILNGGIIGGESGDAIKIIPFSGITEICKLSDDFIRVNYLGEGRAFYCASTRVRDAVYTYMVDMLKHYLSHPIFLPVSTSTKKYETGIELL